jgi:hypothetical protein
VTPAGFEPATSGLGNRAVAFRSGLHRFAIRLQIYYFEALTKKSGLQVKASNCMEFQTKPTPEPTPKIDVFSESTIPNR